MEVCSFVRAGIYGNDAWDGKCVEVFVPPSLEPCSFDLIRAGFLD